MLLEVDQQLVDRNNRILLRASERVSFDAETEIDIMVSCPDRDTALKARAYAKSHFDIPRTTTFYVNRTKVESSEQTRLTFSLNEIPDANRISHFETILILLSEKFGLGDVSWEFGPIPLD